MLGTYAPTYTFPSQTDLWEIGQMLKCVLELFSGSLSKQQTSPFHYLWSPVRNTCVMKRRFKPDRTAAAASAHSVPISKVGTVVSSDHGSRPSTRTCEKHHKGSRLLSQRGPFSCQQGLNCEGGGKWNTPAMCRHCYSFHMGIFSPSVVQTSKQTRSIWVRFMTHFGKFAGGLL